MSQYWVHTFYLKYILRGKKYVPHHMVNLIPKTQPAGPSKHFMLAKPGLKSLHFAKSGVTVYNDQVRAHPMASLKQLDIGNRTLVQSSVWLLGLLYTVVPVQDHSNSRSCPLWGRPPPQQVRAGLVSKDLKRVGAHMPLGQKHTAWIRTGNLWHIKSNTLTTEPRRQIWHIMIQNIAVYVVELEGGGGCKPENILEWVTVIAASQLWPRHAKSHIQNAW